MITRTANCTIFVGKRSRISKSPVVKDDEIGYCCRDELSIYHISGICH
ncbi:hypothetical protein [Microcoleus anatoxicus]